MKNILTLIITTLITTLSFAQIGFNYKALIKDANGNIINNQDIHIRFTLFTLGEFGPDVTYQERHNVTLDNNGIAIATIGEGDDILSGEFPTDYWEESDFLATEIDIEQDGTFVLIGPTYFKKVPMAMTADFAHLAHRAQYAENVTGLRKLNTGWRLVDFNPDNYGAIGNYAMDLSLSDLESTIFGATGEYSVALGLRNEASGGSSTAMGFRTESSGYISTSLGERTTASGNISTAIGSNTNANSYASFAIGRHNMGGFTNTPNPVDGDIVWLPEDPLFEVGNGNSNTSRNNALTIYKNGNAKFDAEIQHTTTGDANLIPIAYGTIESDGNVRSGTGNFTASLSAGVLSISVNGENLTVDNSSCLITTYSTAFRTSSLIMSGGDIDVRIFDSSGNINPTTFQFTIYKL